MGCLTMTVSNATINDLSVTAVPQSGLILDVTRVETNVFVSVLPKNITPVINATNMNTGIGITAALVCSVGTPSVMKLFYVSGDRPLLIEEGYFRVKAS